MSSTLPAPLDRSVLLLLAVLLLAVSVPACNAPASTEAPGSAPSPDAADSHYTYRPASRDGIGKVYMGREISFVLGHRGIAWLEREERAVEERPDRLVELLDLAPDTVIADVGAGSGYFTFRLQPEVPRGRVIAVDIEPRMLEVVEERKAELGVDNVETVLGTVTDPNLPPESLDAALMVDAYHEFSHPREMMENLVRALRPGGRVYLVEYRAEDPDVPMLPLHKMTEAQARREMEAVGLDFVENRPDLPWQHLMVFQRPGGDWDGRPPRNVPRRRLDRATSYLAFRSRTLDPEPQVLPSTDGSDAPHT